MTRALWLVGLTAVACCAAPPTYPCYHSSVSPLLDGDVAGDPAWRDVPAATGFSVLGGGYTVAKQTVVKLLWDDQALYLGVMAEEPDAPKLQLKIRDGGNFWEDDGVEIFLLPAGGIEMQFGVTAGAARGAAEGAPDFTRIEAKSKLEAASYSLEVKFPFAVLGRTPRPGETWHGNVCRNTWSPFTPADRFTSWAPTKSRFNEPDGFAAIEFLTGAVDPQAAARLNAPYRAELSGRLATAVAKGQEYVPTLTQAAAEPRWAARAKPLLGQWLQAAEVLKAAKTAEALEVRRLLTGMAALTKASYDVKYAYLIATVLPD